MTSDINESYQVTVHKNPKTGQVTQEFWETNEGRYYCPHGPAIRRWDEDTGELQEEAWFNKEGEIHRDGGKPARVTIDPYTKIITCEEYFINGKEHRLLEGAPTRIGRDPVSGKIEYEEWKRHGKFYRENGQPSAIYKAPETGVITYEAYYNGEGKLIDVIERDPKTGQEYGEEFPTNMPSEANLDM